jgi:hypothetical protein
MSRSQFSDTHAAARFALIEKYLAAHCGTQRAFCSENKIAYSTFQLWLSKYRRQQQKTVAKPAQFIPLILSENNQHSNSACEIAYPNGLVLRFESIPTPEYLLTLINAEKK